MKTALSIKSMVARNPRAKESEIRKALRILQNAGSPDTKRRAGAAPYTEPIFPTDFTGENEPRRVRLSGGR